MTNKPIVSKQLKQVFRNALKKKSIFVSRGSRITLNLTEEENLKHLLVEVRYYFILLKAAQIMKIYFLGLHREKFQNKILVIT